MAYVYIRTMSETDYNNFIADLQKCENGDDISTILSAYDEYDEVWNDDEMLTKMLKEVSKKGKMAKESKTQVTRLVERIKHLRKPTHPICCICDKVCECQFGNNPYPLAEGRCCNRCNQHVIQARMELLFEKD